MQIQRFRHLALVVRDLEAQIAFYTQTLGFAVKRRYTIASADFQNGVGVPGAAALGVHLTIPNSTAELEMFQFTAPTPPSAAAPLPANQPGYRHMALVVADLAAAYAELTAQGVDCLAPPVTLTEPQVTGFQFIYFRDPEGNLVELNQLPPWA